MSRLSGDGRNDRQDRYLEHEREHNPRRNLSVDLGRSKRKRQQREYNQNLTNSPDENNKLPLEAAKPTEHFHGERSRETSSGSVKMSGSSKAEKINGSSKTEITIKSENINSGTEHRQYSDITINERQNFSKRGDETPRNKRGKQKSSEYYRDFQGKEKPSENIKPKTAPNAETKVPQSKLQFGKADLQQAKPADKGLLKAKGKAEKASAKFNNAVEKLPEKQRLKFERTGKLPAVKSKTPNKAYRLGKDAAHSKINQYENDNDGLKAAHYIEQKGESIYHGGRSAYRHVKEKPVRAAQKAGNNAYKSNVKYSYKKALNENPSLKSNPFSRYMQKKNIKKQYAKGAKSITGNTAKIAQKAGGYAAKATQAAVQAVTKSPVAMGIIIGGFFLICVLSAMLAPASVIGGGSFAVNGGTYPAGEIEINDAELFYTELETDFILMLNDVPEENSGYDEYRYHVPAITHNPHEIISFLSAYYGEFSYGYACDMLEYIFNERYKLSLVESTETRSKTVTGVDDDGEEYEYTENYNWYVLNINVAALPFTTVISEFLDGETSEIYEALLMTNGNRQFVENPLDYDWYPNITCNFGYRVHPINYTKNFHKGIDIAMPVGTNIYAAHDGAVTTASYDEGGYGYYIRIENDDGLVTNYAHCSVLLKNESAEVKAGDLIAKSGNTGMSTGAHLHFEIISNGEYFNPVFFARH